MASKLLDLDRKLDQPGEAHFNGLRVTADEFLELPEDGCRYKLLDGVVILSPSPKPSHQKVVVEIASQIKWFLRANPVGEVFVEIDVHLGHGPTGGDIGYGPDGTFVRAERVLEMREKIVGPPDLVVEVISRGSRRMDTTTKRGDYERHGVREHWIMDPQRQGMTFLRLEAGKLVEAPVSADSFASQAVPGFVLDLKRVREALRGW